MKLKTVAWAVAAVSSLLLAASAQAETLKFTITGAYAATWTLSSTPVPDDFGDGLGFVLAEVPGTFAGAATGFADLYFYSADNGGGMEIVDFDGSGDSLIVTDSPQLYTGTESAPVFRPGTFAMTDYNGSGDTYTLTISAVPEPATVASMLAGLGLIGVAMRRRKVDEKTDETTEA